MHTPFVRRAFLRNAWIFTSVEASTSARHEQTSHSQRRSLSSTFPAMCVCKKKRKNTHTHRRERPPGRLQRNSRELASSTGVALEGWRALRTSRTGGAFHRRRSAKFVILLEDARPRRGPARLLSSPTFREGSSGFSSGRARARVAPVCPACLVFPSVNRHGRLDL
jgi:hypothetical protein